jgi:S-adenosylmethionine hydrolase
VVVVDPGVGSDRRILCAQFECGTYVAPDNGVLSHVAAESRLTRAFAVTNRRFMRPQVSMTFHGRDIMAPVAARLSLGNPVEELGPPVQQLTKLLLDTPRIDEGRITGTIQFIDRFGNLITNIPKAAIDDVPLDARIHTSAGSHKMEGLADCYAARPPGTSLVLVGSNGMLEIAISGGNASQELGLSTGEVVELTWEV